LEEIQAFIAGPSHINFSTAGNLLFLDDTRAIPYQQHLHFCRRRRMQEAARYFNWITPEGQRTPRVLFKLIIFLQPA
jgi:hypothetical protein